MATGQRTVHPSATLRLGIRKGAARWLAATYPAGLMHGAVVMGAVLALVADTAASVSEVASGFASVLVIYWLTHAYTDALGHGMASGDRVHLFNRLLRYGYRDATVLLGGLPALVTFWLATGFGADFPTAVDTALWLTLLILTAVGYLAAHSAGITGWRVVGETAFAALMGVGMVVLNTFLH